MLKLERLAKDVVARWDSGDLAGAVRALDAHLQELATWRTDHAARIEAARDLWANDNCEIDDEPLISPGAPDEGGGELVGCFIGAWVWVGSPT
ncbi:hypothetical protein NU688_33125 [Variovorax sp. ZS18.2.2]|uniref:hypothetical protein n=1 Tax=Variovorax sp. ZS18.2.2 TaxID=2971255 RepID=UPI00215186CC|nr:hypothetical protein [Variovorax sp. ZS18.2.2]MCR6481041.1 hypothetical protein [Variovorax sp. ZS18.2.2]